MVFYLYFYIVLVLKWKVWWLNCMLNKKASEKEQKSHETKKFTFTKVCKSKKVRLDDVYHLFWADKKRLPEAQGKKFFEEV